jgi:SAM-dependent methyltransferase
MNTRLILSVAKGLASYVPVLNRLSGRHTGGTVSARYCYSVWLRHFAVARANGLPDTPQAVVELGPGDSLGTGLAALLCGASRLYAFDVVAYADLSRNLTVLDDLIALFSRREPIPGHDEFPAVEPRLECYDFPHDLLPDDRLRAALDPERLETIRRALATPHGSRSGPIQVRYVVPWASTDTIEEETVDMVYSQAVLEHVTDLDLTYGALRRWLKPGGFMSHEIDFGSHGLTREWSGHWSCSDTTWRWIQGRKPYLLNRHAHSVHLRRLAAHGFQLVGDLRAETQGDIPRSRLAPRFRDYTDEDLRTRCALLQSVKPAGPGGLAPRRVLQ